MKVKNNRLYPYPILSINHDDYKDNTFDVEELELSYDSVTATVEGIVKINDETINNLILDNSIGLFCHIECSTTKYRKIFQVEQNDLPNFKIEIPLKDICDVVEICFVLVANNNIEDYKNNNLNDSYNEVKINLYKYSTLGYTDTFAYEIKKSLNTNGDIPSIFDITKSETEQETTFDYLNGDKIKVFLPAADYNIYIDTKGDAVRIKQMMTVVPALEEIFEAIRNSDDRADFESHGWFPVLEKTLSKMQGYEDGFDSEEFKNNPSMFRLAQKLLKSVSTDAFKEIDAFVTREEEDA